MTPPSRPPFATLEEGYAKASFLFGLLGGAFGVRTEDAPCAAGSATAGAPTSEEIAIAQLALVTTAAEVDLTNVGPPAIAHRWEAITRHLARRDVYERLAWPKGFFPVEARPSPIHGRGVFTTRDVSPGEPLTLYPPDAITYRRCGSGPAEVVMRYEPSPAHRAADLKAVAREYSFHVGSPGTVRVEIVGLPELCGDPAYLGHMANDPVGPAQSEKRYNELALRRANASFAPVFSKLSCAVIACRPIPAGTEVVVPYTYAYWASLGA